MLFFRVGGCIAGDQAGAAAERRVFKATLNENEDAASKLNNVNQVDEEPHQPGRKRGHGKYWPLRQRGR